MHIRDSGAIRDICAIRMIRHDEGDVDLKFAELVTVEEVDEAVIELRHHEQHPATVLLVAQGDRRGEVLRGVSDCLTHNSEILCRNIEPGPQTKVICRGLGELGLLEDVRAHRQQRSGDCVGDAGAVWAAEGKDVGSHVLRVIRFLIGDARPIGRDCPLEE